MKTIHSRRSFIRSSASAGLGISVLGLQPARAVSPNSKLRVLSIGVVGTIGEADRKQVAAHPGAEIVGLCDVDSNALARAAIDHPDAFTCRDYREAFAKYGDKFDAVIVSVPDHSHAPMLLTAMLHNKHVYGQKPLVHQLAELAMVEQALKAKPDLVTQLGNQRMAHPGRRAAVEILRQGMLGKAIESFAWTSSPSKSGPFFNYDKVYRENPVIPKNLDWNLWLGPRAVMPYYDELAPAQWRSWWDFGSNGLGDWGCHLLDVMIFAYDELISPFSVKTEAPEAAGKIFHVNRCKATMNYHVDSDKFTGKTFPIHYYDSSQEPTAEQLRIPQAVNGSNITAVVCEGGTLVLEADGGLKIWRDGKAEQGLRMEGMPKKWPSLNHWHAWVDNCLGQKTELRTPFKDAIRTTEPTILGVKATRFPGQELLWDKSKLTFTNNEEATKTVVRCEYRDGFAPPNVI
ncbi:MAG: Gfo/Idh/MocA family oxidoreductase [Gloeobacteraceae cyanobacterium ES-bin-144]|nr:Gfo/Idh/MocA family oxidoreductase [Verrucomicrobiales bacterium]